MAFVVYCTRITKAIEGTTANKLLIAAVLCCVKTFKVGGTNYRMSSGLGTEAVFSAVVGGPSVLPVFKTCLLHTASQSNVISLQPKRFATCFVDFVFCPFAYAYLCDF